MKIADRAGLITGAESVAVFPHRQNIYIVGEFRKFCAERG
jgi:hypothetical protein